MKYRIGIPRALLYYQFATLWRTFFNCLDAEVVISGETNKRILDEGSARVADEACLPVKIFFGHAAELFGQEIDFLFVPRLVSIEKKAYICPKLMGLPDMVAAGRGPMPPLLQPTLNLVKSMRGLETFLSDIDDNLGCGRKKVREAWHEAQKEYRLERAGICQSCYCSKEASAAKEEEQPLIFLLGHPYLIHDRFLNLNLLEKLQHLDCRIMSPEQVPQELQEEELAYLPNRLFWTFGKTQLGSARIFSRQCGLKGVIILTSFGCGIDSFVDNMVIRHLKRVGIPHLSITLDEHSGEAGLNTRIEAFLDMLRWRRLQDEDNFSSYGTYLGNHEGLAGLPGVGSYRATTFQ